MPNSGSDVGGIDRTEERAFAALEESQRADDVNKADWRFKLGVALFLFSRFGPFVLIPLVAALGFSAAMTASISGGILVGAEVVLGLAAAVMGKSGYAYLKHRIFGFLKRYGPPQEVGRTRHVVGLLMFVLPFLLGWLAPYASDLLPGYQGNELTVAIVSDLILLISLLVLGGDFWDKLRALFIYGARVELGRPEPLAPQLPD
jgi:hypothetical protein